MKDRPSAIQCTECTTVHVGSLGRSIVICLLRVSSQRKKHQLQKSRLLLIGSDLSYAEILPLVVRELEKKKRKRLKILPQTALSSRPMCVIVPGVPKKTAPLF